MPTPLIERYRDDLGLEEGDPVVTLNEGSTPLIHSPRLSDRIGADAYWLRRMPSGTTRSRAAPSRWRPAGC